MVNLRIRVKFRAFGVTLSTLDKQWVVSINPIAATSVGVTIDEKRPIFDQRGVTVWVW